MREFKVPGHNAFAEKLSRINEEWNSSSSRVCQLCTCMSSRRFFYSVILIQQTGHVCFTDNFAYGFTYKHYIGLYAHICL